MGELLELTKSGAGDTESKYQFVDVREEPELAQAKLDGEMSTVGGSRRGAGCVCVEGGHQRHAHLSRYAPWDAVS